MALPLCLLPPLPSLAVALHRFYCDSRSVLDPLATCNHAVPLGVELVLNLSFDQIRPWGNAHRSRHLAQNVIWILSSQRVMIPVPTLPWLNNPGSL